MGDKRRNRIRPTKSVGDTCSNCKRTDVPFYKGTVRCKTCHYKLRWPSHLKLTYGITVEQYNQMFVDQYGKCAICKCSDWGHNSRPSVDHNHTTGVIRGLLCHSCNAAIGLLKDSADVVTSALAYLVKHAG